MNDGFGLGLYWDIGIMLFGEFIISLGFIIFCWGIILCLGMFCCVFIFLWGGDIMFCCIIGFFCILFCIIFFFIFCFWLGLYGGWCCLGNNIFWIFCKLCKVFFRFFSCLGVKFLLGIFCWFKFGLWGFFIFIILELNLFFIMFFGYWDIFGLFLFLEFILGGKLYCFCSWVFCCWIYCSIEELGGKGLFMVVWFLIRFGFTLRGGMFFGFSLKGLIFIWCFWKI